MYLSVSFTNPFYHRAVKKLPQKRNPIAKNEATILHEAKVVSKETNQNFYFADQTTPFIFLNHFCSQVNLWVS